MCIACIGEQSEFGGIKEVVVPFFLVSTSHNYREKFAIIFSGSLAFSIKKIDGLEYKQMATTSIIFNVTIPNYLSINVILFFFS